MAGMYKRLTKRSLTPTVRVGGVSSRRDVAGFVPGNIRNRSLGRLGMRARLQKGRGLGGRKTRYRPRTNTIARKLFR